RGRYRDHMPHLLRMREVARRLRGRREQRGALELDVEQAMVVLDDDDPRRVRDVRRAKPSEEIRLAYGMVEEFMLAANEAVAAFFRHRELDSIWRVHARPDEERVAEFAAVARSYGIELDPEQAGDPRTLRRVGLELRERPAARALSYLLLRSLKQAAYDVVPIGHYGLAARDYLHF